MDSEQWSEIAARSLYDRRSSVQDIPVIRHPAMADLIHHRVNTTLNMVVIHPASSIYSPDHDNPTLYSAGQLGHLGNYPFFG
jgi:hypothetical protein